MKIKIVTQKLHSKRVSSKENEQNSEYSVEMIPNSKWNCYSGKKSMLMSNTSV